MDIAVVDIWRIHKPKRSQSRPFAHVCALIESTHWQFDGCTGLIFLCCSR